MRALILLLCLGGHAAVMAQNTIAFQGFEVPANCPDWAYAGGVVNTETARTGSRSARVGRLGESNMITFAAQTITGYAGVVLSLYHSVRPAPGPAMDMDEGAQIEVQLNGGGWAMIGRMSGFGDYSWGWASVGGNPSSGCTYTCANGLFYNVPAGTNTIAVRVFSQSGSGCPKPQGNYDRSDEGFFIDDVLLTTTSAVITPGSGTVTWTGALDTDWFKCNNWNPQVVPGPLWDVIIDQTAVNQCVIGVSAAVPLDAYASTLVVRSNNATNRTLTISLGRSLTVGGQVTVQRTASTGQLGIMVQSGSFISGGLLLQGTVGNAQQALFRNIVSTNTVQINGNVTINAGGILDLQGAPGGTLGVAGNLSNNDVATAFSKAGSLVVLNGSGAQALSSIATGTGEPYASLRVAKSGGDVTLNAPISIANGSVLDLQQGRIFSTTANLLNMLAGSSVINVSNASFVNGPVFKRGNTNFVFPVGKGGHYRPIAITNPMGNATQSFTAEYFQGDPTVAFGVPMEPTLHHVSHCEWWILDRSAAAQTPLVTLSWNAATSCGVTNLGDLRVAEWYDRTLPSAMWRDRGNGGTTGDPLSGTVITSAAQSQFSTPTPWTLASTTAENPLPIELLSFTAEPAGDRVETRWITASERDNHHFDVERSADAITFERVGSVAGMGNSVVASTYQWPDPDPLAGLSYYRLRQVDLDGTATFSRVVPVHFRGAAPGMSIVRSSDEGIVARHDFPTGSRFEVLDTGGRLLSEGFTAEESLLRISMVPFPHGIYLLRLSGGQRAAIERFVW